MVGLPFAVACSQSHYTLLVFLGVHFIGRTSTSTMLLRNSHKQWYLLNMMRLWDSKGAGNLLRISCVLLTSIHIQRFGLTVSYRRCPSSFYESYTPGHLLDLRSHLVAWAEHLLLLRWCLSSYKQWYRLNMMRLWDSKGLGNLLRISCVLLTNSHTQHDASVETNPQAGLSSIRIPTLDRVWYHAPWWRHYKRYRQCGLLLFGHLLW